MGRILERAHEIAEENFIAASGPGGQNVNKVATAVQLRVNIYALGLPPRIFHRLKDIAGNRLNQAGEIVIDARNHRTQEANRRDARERMADMIEEAIKEPKKRAKTRVNRLNKTKRLANKKAHGEKKALRGKVDY
ncbi:alternative ribosome rescue aminoacyl-tRNA hydrolase ArfB [Aurantiacibacter poecillastricola]|uniref:alternative ribosome rescue aminoacyl-tRNA hydrolase ArfB n=1 Tax=Aurantiacibacter poecillastricola TaxID=3064385 RepID=UPI00273EF34D|nr:alternative ribosome rescue aminoacyl-tRNA hydrolase ArfB [Aurantiacibacter sp. 219JJ12-13]MDP5260759.1 alternative ribosome rescue aminoacyl-tRNA hydrolase ArfB [Aurantiacibacter sp. 219JJ12-13]